MKTLCISEAPPPLQLSRELTALAAIILCTVALHPVGQVPPLGVSSRGVRSGRSSHDLQPPVVEARPVPVHRGLRPDGHSRALEAWLRGYARRRCPSVSWERDRPDRSRSNRGKRAVGWSGNIDTTSNTEREYCLAGTPFPARPTRRVGDRGSYATPNVYAG